NCWSTSSAEPSATWPVALVSSRPTPEPQEHRSLEGQSTLNEPVHAGGGPGVGGSVGAGLPLGTTIFGRSPLGAFTLVGIVTPGATGGTTEGAPWGSITCVTGLGLVGSTGSALRWVSVAAPTVTPPATISVTVAAATTRSAVWEAAAGTTGEL